MFYVEQLHDDGTWRIVRGPYEDPRQAEADCLRLRYATDGTYRVWIDDPWYRLREVLKALLLSAVIVAALIIVM